MHYSECDSSTASSSEPGEAPHSDEGSYKTQMKQAINDVSMTDVDDEFDANGYDLAMAEFIDECNSKTGHPTAYVGEHKEFKQARLDKPVPRKTKAKEAASPEAGMFEVLVNLNEPLYHHQSDASILAMQENTTKDMCDEIVSMFVQHCVDEHSFGVSDDNIRGSVDSQLQLCATS
jgi:hypothetical protein